MSKLNTTEPTANFIHGLHSLLNIFSIKPIALVK